MGQFSKKWEDLNFSDNYIFCKVMRDEKLCKQFIEILLHLKIDKITYLNTEQIIENNYENKGIRLDVFLRDSSKIINLEMQTGDYDDLLLRSRYYQSAADVNSVPRRAHFKDLKENYIVFICKDDPFGFGLPCYTKNTNFKELPHFSYDDKTHNVFYNSSAYAKVEDKEIRSVLEFIYKLKAKSAFTKQLEDSVHVAKQKGTMKDEYMYFQDILEDEKEQARKIGHSEGLAAGLAEGKAKGLAEGKAEGLAKGKAAGLAEGKAKGLAEGLAEGRTEGIAEGQYNNKIETAKRMLDEDCAIDFIMRITNLPKEEIMSLA